MAGRKTLPVSALAVLASLAVAAPASSAEPPPDASCLGVLSAFAGQAGTRDQFAPPVSGARVARIAGEHGDFTYCLNVFLSP
jgi:hypothetical protein